MRERDRERERKRERKRERVSERERERERERKRERAGAFARICGTHSLKSACYRVAKMYRMPQVAGLFSQKSH